VALPFRLRGERLLAEGEQRPVASPSASKITVISVGWSRVASPLSHWKLITRRLGGSIS
jgi:hypothetical protein